jgi:hypothetical protein
MGSSEDKPDLHYCRFRAYFQKKVLDMGWVFSIALRVSCVIHSDVAKPHVTIKNVTVLR